MMVTWGRTPVTRMVVNLGMIIFDLEIYGHRKYASPINNLLKIIAREVLVSENAKVAMASKDSFNFSKACRNNSDFLV